MTCEHFDPGRVGCGLPAGSCGRQLFVKVDTNGPDLGVERLIIGCEGGGDCEPVKGRKRGGGLQLLLARFGINWFI